ncbi:cytochrome c oxidase assembly protein [Aurantimonas sp. A2-1-M11]|uniref:cytochrome c oxidase assembly protein n=1 Tax=Aurantimonas sp. A2-1-M11 TaxID=3113712 RepID=UPI002F93EEE3
MRARGDTRSLAHAWPALLGTVVLAGLWLSPLVELSRRAFSAHMILHLGIVTLAAPLLVIGLRRFGIGLQAIRPGIASAAAASAFDMFVIWGWHTPVLHEAAARHAEVFVFQQLSFLAAGLLLWAVSFAGRGRGAAAIGAFAMFTTFAHMTMLGALLALAPALIYAPDVCIGAFGFETLEDQRLGGVLMAVFGGFPCLVGALVLVQRLVGEDTAPAQPGTGL